MMDLSKWTRFKSFISSTLLIIDPPDHWVNSEDISGYRLILLFFGCKPWNSINRDNLYTLQWCTITSFGGELYLHIPQFHSAPYCCSRRLPSCATDILQMLQYIHSFPKETQLQSVHLPWCPWITDPDIVSWSFSYITQESMTYTLHQKKGSLKNFFGETVKSLHMKF